MSKHGKYSALNPNNPCFAPPTVEVENAKLRAEVERMRKLLAWFEAREEKMRAATLDLSTSRWQIEKYHALIEWERDNPKPEGDPTVTVPVRVSGAELLARYRTPKPEGA